MLLVVMQAARGTKSHFNVSTAFDGIVFSVMGLAIAISTILTGVIAFLYFRSDIDLPRSIVWGMRLGLVVFLAGSFEGAYMSTQIGHAVGVPDGGAGLPLVNWSTTGGDLRVAHFLGLHAFQAVPLFAYFLERSKVKISTPLTFGFAFAYFSVFTLVFVQALLGRPLIAGM
jgi:FtsH-binding integral membrane protein